MKPLLAGVVAEPRGQLTMACSFAQPGNTREEAKEHADVAAHLSDDG
jgi:hypothetical protein